MDESCNSLYTSHADLLNTTIPGVSYIRKTRTVFALK